MRGEGRTELADEPIYDDDADDGKCDGKGGRSMGGIVMMMMIMTIPHCHLEKGMDSAADGMSGAG